MSIRITDTAMVSDQSIHSAAGVGDSWRVSWLPGRLLDRNHATIAMTIAEIAATEELTSDHRYWPHIVAWAGELGLTGPDAVARASGQPTHPEGNDNHGSGREAS